MSKEPSPASDAVWLTFVAVLLSFIVCIALWGLLVLLTDGTASVVRVGVVSAFVGVYLSHYVHLKAQK